ncbi:hypothetical protein PanWU01x14_267690 [Parasponia andersonii]|uniref:Uncharacterized protein n=1 Tax=Parasponia andersonii TaxID=3476 RepID=A0A2P5B6G8_PARAD|nr:hypothetical protein PanWU01x14_267690 [Parasponia andersonii]
MAEKTSTRTKSAGLLEQVHEEGTHIRSVNAFLRRSGCCRTRLRRSNRHHGHCLGSSAAGQAFDYDGLRNALEHIEEYENARVEELKVIEGFRSRRRPENLNIHSNKLAIEISITTGKTLTTGEIVKKVESPFDKLKTFKEVVEGHKSNWSSSSCSTSSDHVTTENLRL